MKVQFNNGQLQRYFKVTEKRNPDVTIHKGIIDGKEISFDLMKLNSDYYAYDNGTLILLCNNDYTFNKDTDTLTLKTFVNVEAEEYTEENESITLQKGEKIDE